MPPYISRRQYWQLRVLIFKLGGVAGAIRRIVRRMRGVFTSSLVYAELMLRYPLLEPAAGQLQDALEAMAHERIIRCIGCNGWELLYYRK